MVDNKKENFTIKIEGMAPIEITYKVLAEDANEALEMIEKGRALPSHLKPKPGLTRKKSAKVYKFGMSNILLQKKY